MSLLDPIRLDSRAASLLARFADQGFERIEPPLLHEAGTFLDLGGEDIRARLYFTSDASGTELCLRPEYTIPVARHYLASPEAGRPASFSYAGPVFRMRPEGPGERAQAGLESFGRTDIAAADAEVLTLAVEAVESGGTRLDRLVMGDAGLVAALLDAVGLPPLWRRRLKRGLEKGLALDVILKGAPARRPDHVGLMSALGGVASQDAHAIVTDLLSIAGIAPVGGRSVEEIADRFLSRAAEEAGPGFGDESRAALDAFFALSGEPDHVSRRLRALADEAGLDLSRALDLFDERTGFIAAQGVDLKRLDVRTAFARNLDYYTGFVFEAYGASADGPVLGGGRYDRLATALGAPEPIPAVGAAIWLDRLDGGEEQTR